MTAREQRPSTGSSRWLRLILGIIYTAMAAGQLLSIDRMPDILSTYGLVHGAAAAALAVALILGETVCGIWFLARPRSTAITPVWVYSGVSLVWSTLAAQAFARGLKVELCGCFGIYLGQSLSWIVLLQEALTLLYAVLLLRGARRASTTPSQRRATEATTTHEKTEPQ